MSLRWLAPGVTAWFLLMISAAPISAQSAMGRPPNLNGGWVAPSGVLQFNFLHRFDVSPPPERKVQNSPTFLVGVGLPRQSMVGFNYATNSDLVRGFPNEWEFFGRVVPLRQTAGHGVDVGVQLGYNQAAASVDGELTAARAFGPLGLFSAARAMSNYAWRGESRFAVAGGATLRLGRWFGVAGDVATLLDRTSAEDVAWSGGLQVGIPYTPHTFSIHATNANTGTLQGASRGSGTVRYGFDYTVPITLRRYFGRAAGAPALPPAPVDPGAPGAPGAGAAADTVHALTGSPQQPLTYLPARLEVEVGTTVVWTNRDVVEHTVTATDGSFDSGMIAPGGSWSRTFDAQGTYEFFCTPHPFMRGVVVVRPSSSGGAP